MPKRERAHWKDQLVTVIERRKINVTIRDQFGFLHSVNKRELKPIDKKDPAASFTFGEE
jgi:hypothetical protein